MKYIARYTVVRELEVSAPNSERAKNRAIELAQKADGENIRLLELIPEDVYYMEVNDE